jgi:hypothetical protein
MCFMAICMGILAYLMVFLSLSGTVLPVLRAQGAQPGVSPVLQTLGDLWEYDHAGRPPGQRLSFEFPESHINLYLSTSLKLKPRPGLTSLSVELLPDNRIIATAEVDMRRLVAEDPEVIPSNLRSQLMRASSLKAEFSFRIESGLLTFTVKPVASNGLDVPYPVLQRIIRSLAAIQPERLDTSKPITLPWGMRELYTQAKLLGGGT